MGIALRVAVTLAIVGLMVSTFVGQGIVFPWRIAGDSMAPTLEPGTRIWVDRTAYWFRSPQRWDVVVVQCPTNPRLWCVKRVAGLPNETLQLIGEQLFINQQPCPAPLPLMPFPGVADGRSRKYHLGPNDYFLLGDNCHTSDDSRTWRQATVAPHSLAGKALWIKR